MSVCEVAVAHASCFSPWLDAVRALVISAFGSLIRLPRILPVFPRFLFFVACLFALYLAVRFLPSSVRRERC